MSPDRQVFLDPRQRRWQVIRVMLNTAGVLIATVLLVFLFQVLRSEPLPELVLPQQRRPYHALRERQRESRRVKPKGAIVPRGPRGPAGFQAAFYVNWDAASFLSLQKNAPHLDAVYPEWLHVLTSDGRLLWATAANELHGVIQDGRVAQVDDRVMPLVASLGGKPEVFPLVNNFDPTTQKWLSTVADFLGSEAARARFRSEVMQFLGSDHFGGLAIDLENIPREAQPGYRALIKELSDALHARGLKLYVNVPPNDPEYDYAAMGALTDGLVLMNYDQHQTDSGPGPIAAQDWFTSNLKIAIASVPREKIVCAIGNYGYDWTVGKRNEHFPVQTLSVQEAWLTAQDSDARIEFDGDALNPRFSYEDENGRPHYVWFMDAVTAVNQMRAAMDLGVNTFALWRLGGEDGSLWAVWDDPQDDAAQDKLAFVPPGSDVDLEGEGEVLKVVRDPSPGRRESKVDPDTNLFTSEAVSPLPSPYRISQYGAVPKKVAITFDDGPDPTFTPRILDALRDSGMHATFFLIGIEAEKYAGLTERIYREGHEIGNHTFTHPDISNITPRHLDVELNLTERLFASLLGVKPLYFRPPYSIDQEPDTADQVQAIERVQERGYIVIGDKIDPSDWRDVPRNSAQQIVDAVVQQLPRGNIILLHDGGGDRTETLKAIPMLARELRARGYEIVPVSALIGKSRDQVMVPLADNERMAARVDHIAFFLFSFVTSAVAFVFFVGDALMTARLLLIGSLAVFDRFHRLSPIPTDYRPGVAVLVPAFNEETVIANTVYGILRSAYPDVRVIVIDDGSTDKTAEVVEREFAEQIESGKVVLMRQQNAGKAVALNTGLTAVTEDLYIGIDADTVIAPDAIAYLVSHFVDARIGAVAGNAKVGNRINLWTRWQALEYITSQNFEKRALNAFSAVSVVPGAIGAWRTAAVRELGGYRPDTVAEDADLTMALLRAGYRVQYEDRALAYTEAPVNARGLLRQRFRWSFGILQAVWKHRGAFLRQGAFGLLALPNVAIFQILLPLVSPFIDLMFAAGAIAYLLDRIFHPVAANPANFEKLVFFFAIFLLVDFLASALAFALERREARLSGDWWLLNQLWLQRFTYRQLFSVVLFRTLARAVQGRPFNWDKLERTASVRAG